MKITLLFSFSVFLALSGCRESMAPNEDVPTLNQRFHGKYRPVSSIAEEVVDLNFDGKPSADLLAEIRDLATTDLRIDIYGPNKHLAKRSYLFYQQWPEQYVYNSSTRKEPTAYDSVATVNYNRQGATRQFEFDQSIKQIYVQPDETPLAYPERFPLPESATIEDGNMIRVVNRKRFYTRSGWKSMRVETVYKRYTTAT
ncbi:hypothetical protein [Spirosoma agri]|uniref:Uncharacterized protein n=1 Tax=Spirosoma agri TaxID=1987381 RepID=A0A6M0IGG6_9BACT|nr:hypothetical protein [Spirosoma agri]NEU66902.1 hypothetical protein [Spirosoma agri]